MILPDVNILIYAYYVLAPEHHKAKRWFETTISSRNEFCLSWHTIMGFVRISTTQRIFKKPFSSIEALRIIEKWIEEPNVRILTPGLGHFNILKRIVTESRTNGAMLMDAHLAALAIEHGAILATTDRDFRRFDGLKMMNPLTT